MYCWQPTTAKLAARVRLAADGASRDPEKDEPTPEDLHDVGVVGVVARMGKVPDGSLRFLVPATQRVRLAAYGAGRGRPTGLTCPSAVKR